MVSHSGGNMSTDRPRPELLHELDALHYWEASL